MDALVGFYSKVPSILHKLHMFLPQPDYYLTIEIGRNGNAGFINSMEILLELPLM